MPSRISGTLLAEQVVEAVVQERREHEPVEARDRPRPDAASGVEPASQPLVDELDEGQYGHDRAHGDEGPAQRGVERLRAETPRVIGSEGRLCRHRPTTVPVPLPRRSRTYRL